MIAAKVDIMASLEKEGMKLYAKLQEIDGSLSSSHQTSVEDCVANMGPIIYISIICQDDRAHGFITTS